MYLYKPGGGAAEEGAPPARMYLPVYVECVTDCPEIVYFDMTRLGSFLASPIVYSSYYSDAALKAAVSMRHRRQNKKDSHRRRQKLRKTERVKLVRLTRLQSHLRRLS